MGTDAERCGKPKQSHSFSVDKAQAGKSRKPAVGFLARKGSKGFETVKALLVTVSIYKEEGLLALPFKSHFQY